MLRNGKVRNNGASGATPGTLNTTSTAPPGAFNDNASDSSGLTAAPPAIGNAGHPAAEGAGDLDLEAESSVNDDAVEYESSSGSASGPDNLGDARTRSGLSDEEGNGDEIAVGRRPESNSLTSSSENYDLFPVQMKREVSPVTIEDVTGEDEGFVSARADRTDPVIERAYRSFDTNELMDLEKRTRFAEEGIRRRREERHADARKAQYPFTSTPIHVHAMGLDSESDRGEGPSQHPYLAKGKIRQIDAEGTDVDQVENDREMAR